MRIKIGAAQAAERSANMKKPGYLLELEELFDSVNIILEDISKGKINEQQLYDIECTFERLFKEVRLRDGNCFIAKWIWEKTASNDEPLDIYDLIEKIECVNAVIGIELDPDIDLFDTEQMWRDLGESLIKEGINISKEITAHAGKIIHRFTTGTNTFHISMLEETEEYEVLVVENVTGETFFIPDTVDGFPVVGMKSTVLGKKPFKKFKGDVRISQNLRKIAKELFQGASITNTIELPFGVQKIPQGCFMHTIFMGGFSLSNVGVIERNAFSEAEFHKPFQMPKKHIIIKPGAFDKALFFDKVLFPEGTAKVDSFGFRKAVFQKDVVFSRGIQIEEFAFDEAKFYGDIHVPIDILDIDDYAFSCVEIKGKCMIPERFKERELEIFSGCKEKYRKMITYY